MIRLTNWPDDPEITEPVNPWIDRQGWRCTVAKREDLNALNLPSHTRIKVIPVLFRHTAPPIPSTTKFFAPTLQFSYNEGVAEDEAIIDSLPCVSRVLPSPFIGKTYTLQQPSTRDTPIPCILLSYARAAALCGQAELGKGEVKGIDTSVAAELIYLPAKPEAPHLQVQETQNPDRPSI
ncbi:unnamed protein product [Tilletia controversa]|uniref:Uncharacterized protein n=2 Tax=Tilletia TaxID=13289 RepID=A0A9N8Q4U3_9BASI|nr:hypothetical protein CF336_g5771 [Tilletia laevis]CAD6886660.1 unnamed protein product [Tilletia caries]CAD6907668.1 unnamed protein product [Tilletia controversa]CAD6896813.1 unnamed protein product [Tilletia laevis]CAD6911308.1 unnamed protein product [Tilletia laevis]